MIELKESELDMGDVPVNTDRFFQVTVRNKSPLPEVVIAQPSCQSCTFFHTGPSVVQANAEGYYTFRFRPDVTGQMIRSVYFKVNDSIVATFKFKANIT